MPLPKRKAQEKEAEWISRCMSDPNIQKESETIEQAYAICKSLGGQDNIWKMKNG